MLCILAISINLALLCPECLSIHLLRISDGDTIVVSLHDKETKIRLYGIDAPEGSQEYGKESTQALQSLLTGHKRLSIKHIDTDRRGRLVCLVVADGKNINEAMIAGGWAWMYRQYCNQSFCDDWLRFEEQARQARLGLWQAENPVPPWEWRHPPVPPDEIGKFRANVRSGKFHRSTCPAFHCKHCTKLFDTRQQALDAGFEPCGACNP